ncbi:MAG: polymerase delta subunit protein [Pseudomonadota bacterium]|jgi:DNA polymerase-3 subunit delta'
MMFDYLLSNKPLPSWLSQHLSQKLLQPDFFNHLSQTIGINDPYCTGGSLYAVAMAHALLCETPLSARTHTQGLACGLCSQCTLLKAGNHSDLMCLVPENIDKNLSNNKDNKDNKDNKSVKTSQTKDNKDKKLSKVIKIEQLRALDDTIMLSSQRGGRKVVIIYPAEVLGHITANALLKILEEPPINTFFIVVSEKWGQVLPTLRSRCVCDLLTEPAQADKIAWLEQFNINYPGRWLELSMGRVGTALSMAQDPLWLPLLKLVPYLLQGVRIDVLTLAQEMAKAELKQVLQLLILWLHDVLAVSQQAPARFFVTHSDAIHRLVPTLKSEAAADYGLHLMAMTHIADHPLNVRSQCESLLFEYKKLFN